MQFSEALIFPPLNQETSPLVRSLSETFSQGDIQSKYSLACLDQKSSEWSKDSL